MKLLKFTAMRVNPTIDKLLKSKPEQFLCCLFRIMMKRNDKRLNKSLKGGRITF